MMAFLLAAPACLRPQKKELYAAVPVELRARLLERLDLLVEYQRTQQWERQYELLASMIREAESKSPFIENSIRAYKNQERAALLDFTPFRVDFLKVKTKEVWMIFGCSQVLEKGRKANMLMAVQAYRERDDWFFSTVEEVSPAGLGNPCKPLAPDAPAEQ